MTPDPAFLALVTAEADEADRIYEQERLARHAPVLMVAEAAMVPDPCPACHGEQTVIVAGPDYFDQYDTDDCPVCAIPNEGRPSCPTRT